MSWLDKLRKPHPPRKQLLFFAQEELANEYFAVIRMTWFEHGKICGVTESHIHTYDDAVIAEFTGIVGEALRMGADVSALSIATAEELGIEPT
tara:strand:- start:854 stop:1132 length:279 start_codon:yes stop_codon:yes gene_type:complete